jgi:hypothetical protein
MRHLSPSELVDLAEGSLGADARPHFARCPACRRRVSELQSTLRLANEAEVPEPSPLFWDHLSARIREALVDQVPTREPGRLSWRLVTAVAGVALVAVAVGLTWRSPGWQRAPDAPAGSELADAGSSVGEWTSLADDPSLAFVAELADNLEWDAVAEAGLGPRAGALDHALGDLTEDESVELRRLLVDALAKAGA